MPGPKPLPKNVHALRGNPSKLNLGSMSGAVEPDIEIPDCPRHLLPEAKKFWKRLTPELEKLGLVAKIDQAALALVCQEWAWTVWHETALQRDIRIAQEREAAFLKEREAAGSAWTKGEWVGGDGFTLPTPNGSFTYNPHWVARNKHALLLDKFLASFGMSASSRGRVTPSSKQAYLPGLDPEQGFSAL